MAKAEGSQPGLLVDIDTGVLRRDHMLVQSGRGVVVFMGFGRRAAQLDRFAFSDEHDPDPFIAHCRAIAELIENGELEKAAQLGVPRAILAIEDKALRRLAIAEALAKAGFNAAEPRKPAHSTDGGEWTSGDGAAGANVMPVKARAKPKAPTKPKAAPKPKPSPKPNPLDKEKDEFVKAHLADAQKAADELGVPVENILGLTALESGWGEKSRFALPPNNNYLNIYYPARYATGFVWNDKHTVRVATFANYADCLRSFVAESASVVRGVRDPETFAAALQNSGKYGIDPKTRQKVPDFVPNAREIIEGLRPYIARERRRA